jgi:hypothetical protein
VSAALGTFGLTTVAAVCDSKEASVRIEDYQLLLAACHETARKQPQLQRLQRESAEQSATSISREMESFLGAVLQDREKTHEIATQTMQPLLMLFDLGLLQVCDLSHFAWQNRDSRVRLIWPDAALPSHPNPTRVFYLLVSNLAQLLQAVRVLLLGGFEGQSRAMFRTFVELADLTLAVVADESIYRNYITVPQDGREQYQHWRRYLAPGVIRRRLAKLDDELDLGAITSIPAAEVREDTYEWFSLFSHIHMVAHLVSAYPPQLDEQSHGAIAMLGEAGPMTRSTFSRILLYLWLFFLHFDRLLWEGHRWDRFRGARWRGWYRYRSRVFDMLFRENYDQLQGITRENGA